MKKICPWCENEIEDGTATVTFCGEEYHAVCCSEFKRYATLEAEMDARLDP